jgi:hypothetical protein
MIAYVNIPFKHLKISNYKVDTLFIKLCVWLTQM